MAILAIDGARFFFAQDMADVEHLALPGGEIAIFSRRNPTSEGTNEDSAAIIPLGDGLSVLAVADGMGGQPAGDQASSLALKLLAGTAGRAIEAGAGPRDAILDGFEEANRRVTEITGGARTTLAAVEIDGDRIRSYHAGDSAVLLVGQRGKLKHLTVSHSPVGYAVEAGLLDEEEAMVHDERHIVSNVIGDRDMKIEVGPSIELADKDTLLLASDGLFDNLRQEEITDAIRKGPLLEAARTLASSCASRMVECEGGHPCKPDDLTFVLYRSGNGKR